MKLIIKQMDGWIQVKQIFEISLKKCKLLLKQFRMCLVLVVEGI